MKKVFMFAILASMLVVTSCGGEKKEEKKEGDKSEAAEGEEAPAEEAPEEDAEILQLKILRYIINSNEITA